jgi:hypothetical protein
MADTSGQYQLSVILKTVDQMSGGLGKGVSNLKKFGTASRKALADYDALRKGIAKPVSTSGIDKFGTKLRATTKDLRAFKGEQNKLSTRLGKPTDTTGLDSQIQKLRAYRRELRATAKESGLARTSMRGGVPARVADDTLANERRPRRGSRRPLGLADRVERVNDFYQAGRQVGSIWRERADSLRPYVEEATRLLRAQERFKIIGLPEAQNAQAFAAIRQNVSDIKGITLADTTENMLDLVGALGDVNQAVNALPLASKYKLGFETLFGDTFSGERINEEVRASFKFLELTGNTMKGAKRMEEMLDVVTKIGASTGGRVSPNEILLMARRGNPAIQSLSATGLRNLSTLIEDMGAEQTGTALQSLYTAIVGGVMKESATAEFGRLGLLDAGKFRVNKKTGLPSKVLPGGNRLAPLLQDDPLKAADLLMERMKAKGIDTSDNKAVQAELQILFQNRNAFRMMNMLTTQRSQIQKESERAAKAKGVTAISEQLKGSPLMKVKEYEAAMTNLRAELGQGILPLLSQFAETATPVARFFATHPTVTQWSAAILIGGKALGGLVETSSVLLRGGSSLYRVFDSWGSGADRAAGAMSRAEREALGLGSGISKLGLLKFVGVTAGLTIASIVVGKVIAEYMELKEWRVKQDKASLDSLEVVNRVAPAPKVEMPGVIDRKSADSFLSRTFGIPAGISIPSTLVKPARDMRREAVLKRLAPENTWSEQAQIAWKNLNAGHALEYATDRSTMPYLTRLNPGHTLPGIAPMESWTGGFDVKRVAGALPHTLENAGVMAEFRKMLIDMSGNGKITSETRANTEQALQYRFGAAFDDSSKLIVTRFLDLSQGSSGLLTNFARVTVSAQGGASALDRARDSATSFATNVGNIQFPNFLSSGIGGVTIPSNAGGSKNISILDNFQNSSAKPFSGFAPKASLQPVDLRPSFSETRGALMETARSTGGGDFHANVTVSPPPGSTAANDPEALASLIEAKLRESFATHLWNNADEVERLTVRKFDRGRERAGRNG